MSAVSDSSFNDSRVMHLLAIMLLIFENAVNAAMFVGTLF